MYADFHLHKIHLLSMYVEEDSHIVNNNISGIFLFSIFFILVLYRSSFFNNFVEISPENRVL